MSSSSPPDYVLGHSEAELQRLEEQARFFGDLTALVFREAGLRKGMHVLDIGSGAGDVAKAWAASEFQPAGDDCGR
jgi:cyclopropane fatty-acyl-phospholipid synthase-like methyltransferase